MTLESCLTNDCLPKERLGDRNMLDEFNEKNEKIQPEPSRYGYQDLERSRRISISVKLAISISISILIIIPLSYLLGRFTASPNLPATVVPVPPTQQITPTADPTQAPPSINPLNMPLACQRCEEPKVVAFIKSYSTDSLGDTSLTILFTNRTSNAVDMKVDTIKMIDQSGNSIPLHSSDPYVPITAGQTTPMLAVLQFIPQPGSKYTFSIVVEEANAFTNFYQSIPLTLT